VVDSSQCWPEVGESSSEFALGFSATGMPKIIPKDATREEMDHRATMTRELKTMETTSSQQLAILLEGLSKSLLRILDWRRVDTWACYGRRERGCGVHASEESGSVQARGINC
jgi:hypothetical protein